MWIGKQTGSGNRPRSTYLGATSAGPASLLESASQVPTLACKINVKCGSGNRTLEFDSTLGFPGEGWSSSAATASSSSRVLILCSGPYAREDSLGAFLQGDGDQGDNVSIASTEVADGQDEADSNGEEICLGYQPPGAALINLLLAAC